MFYGRKRIRLGRFGDRTTGLNREYQMSDEMWTSS